MATPKLCSTCNKELGGMICTGCNEYFCKRDFKTHQDGMLTEMDKIIEERNHLQDAMNNTVQNNDEQNPVIEQINQWQNSIIEKVNRVAAQARQQAIQLLNSKRIELNTEFKSFSQELAHLKESENFTEHDLIRLNEMISLFKQDLRQSTQATTVELHTTQSDEINWDILIYVEEKQTSTNNQQQQVTTESQAVPSSPQPQLTCCGRRCAVCGYCRDWYHDIGYLWKLVDGATCRYDAYYGRDGRDYGADGYYLGYHDALDALCCCE